MSKIFAYTFENVSRMTMWSNDIVNNLSNILSKINSATVNDIGLRKMVFFDLLKRICFGFNGLKALFKEFESQNHVKHSIGIQFRGCLSDALTGVYLLHFGKDEKSFENEIDALNIDFAKFAKFIMENENKILIPVQDIDDKSLEGIYLNYIRLNRLYLYS